MGQEQVQGARIFPLSAFTFTHSPIALQLVDHHTKQVVARSRYTRSSLWSSKRISIEVDPQVVPVLDAILLSFIICEKDRRDQEEATVANSAVIV